MLNVERREPGGGKPHQLRKRGLVPMGLVERSHVTLPLQATADAVRHGLSSTDEHGRIQLTIAGETAPRMVMVKNVETDALAHRLIHITLQEVADDDELKVDVPVRVVGESIDVERGDVMMTIATTTVKLKGKVAHLPEHIDVDVSSMHVGEHLQAGQLTLPDGVTLLTSPEATIVTISVVQKSTVEEADEAVAATEPTEA